jgi:photosystem II stability/assembly factor-like uncharacterized protein
MSVFVAYRRLMTGAIFLAVFFPQLLEAQQKNLPDSTVWSGLKYRCLGPSRGGRSTAVTGVPGESSTFYMGTTGGGVWKTNDAGNSWKNISDGFFGGSIGSIAVCAGDPNVLYVGGGENTLRGNVSSGYGIWKTEDAGVTWKNVGLNDGGHITRLVVDAKNPDIVYAAVLGHAFGPNEERGLYRTRDGGRTWQRILHAGRDVGCVEVAQDPLNHRVLYAATWRARRTPYSFESGGEGSTLWKSTDGGDTWTDLSKTPTFPKGPLGIIGVSPSAARRDRVYAIVEAAEGGVFRSDDAGKTWTRTSADRNLRQRAWYFSKIYADPSHPDRVYVLNVEFHRSDDAGATFTAIGTPHADHHDLWISSVDPNILIVADDGGGQVSLNGGKSWSSYHNQPTAQFYRVVADNDTPYRLLAAQQDNSTVRIEHATRGWGLQWEGSAGGESGHMAAHPNDPDWVFGGSYGGYLTWYNHRTKEGRSINVWPDNPIGHGAQDLKYRFQWNFPLFFSAHDPNVLYTAANVLFKSTDNGQSWTAISPDLTRNDTTKMATSGGPITKDNTSVEYYGTLFAAAESPLEKGLLWVGSDDGLLHVSRNGGQSWTNITPPTRLLPEWTMINCIDPHPFVAGGAYVAATAYKSDDPTPYLLRTLDYGKTWTLITRGVDKKHFTRAIRADRRRPGLLYCGTEAGMYLSFDDGENWMPFQLNLPIVPITDLCLKDDDLIVATQGRSLWILDNLAPLRSHDPAIAGRPAHFYPIRPAYRGWAGGSGEGVGASPVGPAMFDFYLRDTAGVAQRLRLDIWDANGRLVRRLGAGFSDEDLKKDKRLVKIPVRKGHNRVGWDLRYPGAEKFEGLTIWDHSGLSAILAAPGTYRARLFVGKDSLEQVFVVKKDPKSTGTEADIAQQFDFLLSIRDKLTETHRTIRDLRNLRTQIGQWKIRFDIVKHADLVAQAERLSKALTEIEEALYQTRNQSPQDPINFPNRLNDKLSGVAGQVDGDFPPTEQAVLVRNELFGQIDAQLSRYRQLLAEDLPRFNEGIRAAAIPAVTVP